MARETEKKRLERNFTDELKELRVAQTGVQILFAFLLTLPFTAGFPHVTPFQRDAYLVALVSAAAATALIIAPVAMHSALFRRGRKSELVRYAHRVSTGALGFLLIAMASAVLLITDYVLPRGVALLLSAITALAFLLLWVGLPLTRRDWGRAR
ncbi:DUF6328 family protein [Micromonospora arida]|uniref:Amine oxidase n=2 Tax=Micromonospora TaxID=1873 RepID=A0A3N9WNU8_9ACTN|nr:MULTISPECIES: DUF6328 family protein [Micromonospora]RQX02494.1 amine oxidase [Micromonospora inaquosa]WSK49814.1 DUF6328 family protein [Micromonospora zamorensis]